MEPATEKGVTASPADKPSLGETAQLLMREMRPKQWVKNFIIYAPLLFSGKFTHADSLTAATLCTVAFCLVSSGIYVLNDVVDIEADRAHPTKCKRPLASGRLDVKPAAFSGMLLLLGGLALAFSVRHTLVVICLGYMAINVMYSIKLKNFPIIDVFCIASGFVIRAVAGAAAVWVAPSSWFLLCTSLGALFLGLEKRRQELKILQQDSHTHRKALKGYSIALLGRLESIVVPSLLTAYAFYSFQSFHGQWMMMTVPIVLYGIMRYQVLSEQGTATGAPEDVFWRDRAIQITILLWILSCAVVIYGQPGYWVEHFGSVIDSMKVGP